MSPRVLIYDIETSPILAHVWKLWDNNVSLNQIQDDWYVMSWAAKWLGESKVMYQDQRNARNPENDKKLLKGIWKLLDKCDVVVTQNGKKFDQRRLNARFIIQGMKPPSPYRHIDTVKLARKHFGFTSNKLQYLTSQLCSNYKKSTHEKFSGFELWKECLAGNEEAWKEMEKYNKLDVLSLEELYLKLAPWDNSVDFNTYHDTEEYVCSCGSTKFYKRGFAYTNYGKYQRYQCRECGAWRQSRTNLHSIDKRRSILK